MRSLFRLLQMDVLEYLREPAILFWTVVFPVGLTATLGFATMSQDEAPVAIAVASSDSAGRRFLDTLPDQQQIRIVVTEKEKLPGMLTRGEAVAILSGTPELKVAYDPANKDGRIAALLMQTGNSTIRKEILRVPGTRYIDFLLPGMIALGVMNGCAWGVGYSIIEFRSKKLLKRMAATPMPKWQFLFSLIIMRFLQSVVETALLMAVAIPVFSIFSGFSWISFAVVMLAGNFTFSSIGILAASRTDSTRIGNGWINLITLPGMILGGIFFAYTGFPEAFHPLIRALPLTAMTDAMRSVMNEGALITDMTSPLLVMAAWGVITFSLGLRIFRWR